MVDIERDKAECDDATYNHIVKYTGLFGGVQGINMLIGVLRNKVAAALLGPAGIALINIYNKVIGLVNQATNLGISFSAVKYIAELSELEDKERLVELISTVRLWSLMTAAFGSLVCFALSPWISLLTFQNYEYTGVFCVLSIVVAIMSIVGGEMAILKGLKQLKKVAAISTLAAIGTLLVCVPSYYLWSIKGIVVSLVLSNIVVLGIHLYYTSKVVPWRFSLLSKKKVLQGIPMAKLGVAYVVAGILGQGSDYFINAYILNHGTLDSVGLYNTGYFLAISIGSMLFVSVEADFFPRLSGLVNDRRRMNLIVNRQIEVCVLLISPCLILGVIAMPLMVRMLYTEEFLQAATMAVCASFYLFFKALTLPASYLALAKGHSTTYLVSELFYDLFVSLAIPIAYIRFGLSGAGCALSLASVFDFCFIYLFYGYRYGFRISLRPIKAYLEQFLLIAVCICASLQSVLWLRWVLYLGAFSLSLMISYRILGRETDIIPILMDKVRRKIGK